MRLGGSYWWGWIGCGLVSRGWFSEQSWENVVIKFVNLWGRPCSGSQLNLWAAGKRLAHNSSTDEQRADLSTAEAKPHRFQPTCRIVSGITMKTRGQTGVSLSISLPLSLSLLLPLSSWPICRDNWMSLHTGHQPAFLQSSSKGCSCSHKGVVLLK